MQGEELSLEAVIGAIRRYPIEQRWVAHQNLGRLFRKLTVRNKIVDVAILNDPEITAALGKFASMIDYRPRRDIQACLWRGIDSCGD